jgi:ankyrin repeat protein
MKINRQPYTQFRKSRLITSVILLLTALLFISCSENTEDPVPRQQNTHTHQPSPKVPGPDNELLLKAAESGDLQQVKNLLAAGAAINSCTNSKGYTPLHGAVNWDRTEIAKYLLDQDADVNATPDRGDATPLMLLMRGARIDMVRLLLENGANANAQTSDKHILESWLEGFSFFTNYSVNAGNFNDQQIEILKLLLENGADANYRDSLNHGLLSKVEEKFMYPETTDFSYFANSGENLGEILATQAGKGIAKEIHPAYAEKKLQIIELLKEHGAKP